MDTIYNQAIDKWGAENQCWQAVEECGELISAINQFRRGRCGAEKVAEEIADAAIMLEQLRILVDGIAQRDIVERFKRQKLERLEKRIKEEQHGIE